MTISDLKTGMKVVQRDGMEFFVALNTKTEDILVSDRGWQKLSHLDNNLKSNLFPSSDIVKVYESSYENYLSSVIGWSKIWDVDDKPEVEEITADEAMKRLEEQSGKKVKIIR